MEHCLIIYLFQFVFFKKDLKKSFFSINSKTFSEVKKSVDGGSASAIVENGSAVFIP